MGTLPAPDLSGLKNFSQRYALELFEEGSSVLVDLLTGQYFEINSSAARICLTLQDTFSIADAIERIASDFSVPDGEAALLLSSVSEGLAGSSPRDEFVGPFRYQVHPDGTLTFEDGDQVVFLIEGPVVRMGVAPSDLRVPVAYYLRSVVPKLLALLEVPVLHASACRIGDARLAISGKSGAGKTTTALALQNAGAGLIAEDLLILSLDPGSLAVFTNGEGFAREWAAKMGRQFELDPNLSIDYSSLAEAQRGRTEPLTCIWFVDSSRRLGSEFQTRSLSTKDGVLSLLGNGFLASTHPLHWRRFLGRSRLIADRLPLSEATMPAGLTALQEAARRYMANSTL